MSAVESGFMIGTDIAQWGVIVTFLVGVTTLFLNVRRRDRERDHERDSMTKWRTNTARDLEMLQVTQAHDRTLLSERLQRLQGHDERLFERIDQVLNELKNISERLVHLESSYNNREA